MQFLTYKPIVKTGIKYYNSKMKSITKTIPVLTRELKELETELSGVYKLLGHKVLADSADPSSNKTAAANTEIIKWQKLKDERASCTENILNIKSSGERITELKNFLRQIEKTNKAVKKDIEKTKTDFLWYLYKNTFASCTELFKNVQEAAAKQNKIIDEASAELEGLQAEKERTGFFSKLAVSHKITVKQGKIKKAEQEIKTALNKAVDDIRFSQEIKTLYEADGLPSEIKAKYENLLNLYEGLDSSEERVYAINEEKKAAANTLEKLGAGKNADKQTHHFTVRVKEIDAEIGAMTEDTGLRYANRFYLPGGKPAAENFDAYAQDGYADYLERIRGFRVKIEKTKYDIEICRINGQIKNEEKKIEKLNRSIKNSKTEIEKAEKRIAESKTGIKTAKEHIGELKELLQKLSSEFSDDTSNDPGENR